MYKNKSLYSRTANFIYDPIVTFLKADPQKLWHLSPRNEHLSTFKQLQTLESGVALIKAMLIYFKEDASLYSLHKIPGL